MSNQMDDTQSLRPKVPFFNSKTLIENLLDHGDFFRAFELYEANHPDSLGQGIMEAKDTGRDNWRREVLEEIFDEDRRRYFIHARGFYNFYNRHISWRPSVDEFRSEATRLAREICNERRALINLIDGRTGIVERRWAKKTVSQRTKILRTARADIPEKRHAEYHYICRGPSAARPPRTEFDIFKMPDTNIENLCSPGVLPRLLISRARDAPSEFANNDFAAAHVGLDLNLFNLATLENYTMYMDGQSEEDYGEIVSWSDSRDAEEHLKFGLGVTPGVGLFTLDLQLERYQFYTALAKQILHDNPEKSVANSARRDEDNATLKSTLPNNMAGFATQAYLRTSADIDYDQLRALSFAKLSGAEEHVRTLHEDPSYFWDMVGDASEHSKSLIKDKNRQTNPFWNSDDFWIHIKLMEDFQNLGLSQTPYHELPRKYIDTLLLLRKQILVMRELFLERLSESWRASPAFRSGFFSEEDPSINSRTVWEKATKGKPDELKRILLHLTEGGSILTTSELLDELDSVLQNASEREKISGCVSRILADLSLVSHIERELFLFPWMSAFEYHWEKSSSRLLPIWVEHNEPATQMERLVKPDFYTLERFEVKLSQSSFDYPFGLMTKARQELLRKSERFLDSIVECYNIWCDITIGTTPGKIFWSKFSNTGPVERTPEWIEPSNSLLARKARSKSRSKSKSPRTNNHPRRGNKSRSPGGIADVRGQQTRSPAGPSTEAKLKVKEKTRGEADPARILQDLQITEVEEEKEPVRIYISFRSYVVFCACFFNPFWENRPRQITWREFEKAMVDAGFSLREGSGGSNFWFFRDPKEGFDKALHYHMWHGKDAKIPPNVARNFGRRITVNLGWDLSNFVVRDE